MCAQSREKRGVARNVINASSRALLKQMQERNAVCTAGQAGVKEGERDLAVKRVKV